VLREVCDVKAGKKNVEVSVVIVNRNTKDLLRNCLLSLPAGFSELPYEVWVADNASTDGSVEMVKQEFPEVGRLCHSENLGFARANNTVLQFIQSPMALLLNSDTVVTKGSLAKLYRFLVAHPDAAIVGPKLVKGDGTIQPSTYPLPSVWRMMAKAMKIEKLLPRRMAGALFLGSFWDHDATRRVGRLTGACVLVRVKDLELTGFLDEEFYFYGEIHDLCWCVWERGRECWFYPESVVTHLGGQTATMTWNNRERRRRMWRANERLLRKHLPSFKARLHFILSWWAILLTHATHSLTKAFTVSSTDTEILKVDHVWHNTRLKQWLRSLLWGILNRVYQTKLYSRVSELRMKKSFGLSGLTEFKSEAEQIRDRLLELAEAVKSPWPRTGMLEMQGAMILYQIIRSTRPRVVVETGVANGVSSTFVLAALEANGQGKLYSIDYTPVDDPLFLPAGKEVGWMVPEELCHRWQLKHGKSDDELPGLLVTLGKIDLFFHDSDHSYETMMFEYRTAWPHLVEDGFLLSDDTRMNTAFDDFAYDTEAKTLVYKGRLGVMMR